VLLGGFVRHPVLAVLLAAAIVASAAAHVRVARLLLLGQLDPTWRRSVPLERFGGRFPDASPRELAVLVPIAVFALLLGLWPVPLLQQIADGVRDASAAVDPQGPDPR
jgi:NADH:ubiquinone oxidoreductase subunit 4 (subunit M)